MTNGAYKKSTIASCSNPKGRGKWVTILDAVIFNRKAMEMIDILYTVCITITIGVIAGMFAGGIKATVTKPSYTQEQIDKTKAFTTKVSTIVKWLTFMLLIVGAIWCVYFLAMGILDEERVDYATGMSQLIVSVLTIISIMFAFFEFLRRK